MATDAEGRWAAATTGREMPRQNGKGDEVEVVELWGLIQRGECILHTVHDAVLLASQAQQRMLAVLDHAELRSRKRREWRGTGQQMIEMANGGVIWYRTRTSGGGRGAAQVDRLVVDEAQHATDDHLSAVSPTLLAAANPQLNALGTSALAGHSDWWWGMRRRALAPDPGAYGYIGHTAERVRLDESGNVEQDPVDLNDRALWVAANPYIAAGRGGGIDALEEQFQRLSPEAFGREHLGIWDPAPRPPEVSALDLSMWAGLVDIPDDRPHPIALGIEVSPDRTWSTIGLAGHRPDGITQVQVVEAKRGTAWVVERIAELAEKWSPVAVALDPNGPAGALIGPLAEARVKTTAIVGRESRQACVAFYDAVLDGRIRHDDAPVLNVAVKAAKQDKPDADLWAWAPTGTTDISPLQAVTWAVHALVRTPQRAHAGKAHF